MRRRLIKAIVGQTSYPTGAERINSLFHAILWRLSSLPGLDAYVADDGKVRVFRVRK